MSTDFLCFLAILITIPLWCLVHDIQSISQSLEDIAYELILIRKNKTDDLDEEDQSDG